jgi:phosphoglycerol transferase
MRSFDQPLHVGLAFMLVAGVAFICAKKFERISPFFWLSSGTLIFSMAGGVNYLLGSFGFLLLRATNRCSILLSCMALYFICEQVPLVRRGIHQWMLWLVAALLIIVGIWDQVPRYPLWEEAIRQKGWADYKSDQGFFGALEKTLPIGGMVFELPVKDYPEMGPIRNMGDYEHFRPMLHTKELRFSYGTIKGRGDIEWQKDLSSKDSGGMIAALESYGFSAILINRKAYEDRGELLKSKILGAGAELLAENNDFFVFRITPAEKPILPPRNRALLSTNQESEGKKQKEADR